MPHLNSPESVAGVRKDAGDDLSDQGDGFEIVESPDYNVCALDDDEDELALQREKTLRSIIKTCKARGYGGIMQQETKQFLSTLSDQELPGQLILSHVGTLLGRSDSHWLIDAERRSHDYGPDLSVLLDNYDKFPSTGGTVQIGRSRYSKEGIECTVMTKLAENTTAFLKKSDFSAAKLTALIDTLTDVRDMMMQPEVSQMGTASLRDE